ncbi:hypothetical protein BH24DEI1_BH24DEI1_03470 [soil metagenome]|jgi:hypothetical protein|nr:hypothetical protein [Deinococcota bacterium]
MAEKTTWPDLAIALFERLTERGAVINYEFKDMVVEVPRDTGNDSPRAVWRLDGQLRVTTDEPAK